uniref:PABS domain-containing protein n=1 Tax=Ascaris lumbricoides TaxID=6252 RepID=A0A0M3IUC8_ASCLU
MLSIGLGGAMANLFLRYTTENVNLTTVEIDAAIVEVAKKYFGYVEDERQHCVVGDGVQFLSESVRKVIIQLFVSENSFAGNKFDVILLDACKNTEKVVLCPVEAFLEKSVIQSMVQTLSKDGLSFQHIPFVHVFLSNAMIITGNGIFR